MTTPRIEVRDLVRRFRRVEAVAGLTFAIEPGQVVGFIGPNGAGKTTTLRIMATLDVPTAGVVRIDGLDTREQPTAIRRRIGWLPDAFPRVSGMTAWEFLDFFACAQGFRGAERERRVSEIVDFTDIGDLTDYDVGALSRGMTQRLLLGRALVNDPPVLLMDEPAAGLDPKARIDFRRLVRLLAEEGKTLLISSHILSELEEMCDMMLFIDHGRLVHHGSTDSLKRGDLRGATVLVRVAESVDKLRQWTLVNHGVRVLDAVTDGLRLELESAEPAFVAERLRAMVLAGLPVTEFRIEERRLEEAFVAALSRSQAS